MYEHILLSIRGTDNSFNTLLALPPYLPGPQVLSFVLYSRSNNPIQDPTEQ